MPGNPHLVDEDSLAPTTMAPHRDPKWLAEIERFGVKSLIKLVLAVFSILFLLVLISHMPGIERLSGLLQIPFDAVVSVVVTVVLLILFYRIAVQSDRLIRNIQTTAPERRDLIAATVYWGVLMFALAIAYHTFGPAGRAAFDLAGFGVFYPLFFIILAIVPLTLLVVEIGAYAQSRRGPVQEEKEDVPDVQTVEEVVYDYLKSQDGIAPQGDLKRATGWSTSKTSRILSRMESDGWIVRYQVGREKVVCLPGNEPRFVATREDRRSDA